MTIINEFMLYDIDLWMFNCLYVMFRDIIYLTLAFGMNKDIISYYIYNNLYHMAIV